MIFNQPLTPQLIPMIHPGVLHRAQGLQPLPNVMGKLERG